MNRRAAIILLFILFAGCREKEISTGKLFSLLKPAVTGIDFVNRVEDSDRLNIIQYLYFYNGGGVAVGDINNDGLPDIYFTSNLGSNKLYLNQGNLKFKDITAQAGVGGTANWTTGVTMADVNGDGWLDIYVCEVGGYLHLKGRNRLYINNGNLTFTEQAEKYNLHFSGFATHASFFDYDRDGDLDVYLLNHSVHANYTFSDLALRYAPDDRSGDKLMRNDNGVFTDVTLNAGILTGSLGYGLSVTISDFNHDGWSDIYVCNDFRENDYLYINNQDGTFRQVIEKSVPHSSRFSMGADAADINNDLRTDLITLDMLPDDDAVRKQSAGEDSYEVFHHKLTYGFHYQFSRNALQLNRGNDRHHNPMFSDIAAYAGLEATDWSWAALFADFDNDGWKDVFITNGIARRPNDMDYISFIANVPSRTMPDMELIRRMPEGKVPNRVFKNQNGYRFTDMTSHWIDAPPDCSHGAAYADFDLDGDLDLVVNVMNEPARLYRNNADLSPSNFLRIRLHGEGKNTFGVGATVQAYAADLRLAYELIPSRGWQSAVEPVIHAGLGQVQTVDSLVIQWPDGKVQILSDVPANQTINIYQAEGIQRKDARADNEATIFNETALPGLQFVHKENDYSAISVEPLLPFMYTTAGPPMAVADINNDGREDLFIGGGIGQPGSLFVQQADGSFRIAEQPDLSQDADAEDTACALVDVNNDGFADLIVAGGGHQFHDNDKRLKLRLYLNNRKGLFIRSTETFNDVFTDASVIAVADFNKDGLMDVFLGGRVTPAHYGKIPKSYLLQNTGEGKFTDVTDHVLGKHDLGRVSGAVWADINHDNLPDLVIAGHWMPVTVYEQQEDGKLINKTEAYGLGKTHGLWNTLTLHDLNKDGFQDIIAGNMGLNSQLRIYPDRPLIMYISDFDANGTEEQILMYNLPDKPAPFLTRDQLVKQIPSLKRKFLHYVNYSKASLTEIFTEDHLRNAKKIEAHMLESVLLKNTGGTFELIPLPAEVQFAPVYACVVTDAPEQTKLLLAGNLTALQPELGYWDAGYGAVVVVDENFRMKTIPSASSGFTVRGEVRDMKVLHISQAEKNVYIVSRNNRSLVVFKRN